MEQFIKNSVVTVGVRIKKFKKNNVGAVGVRMFLKNSVGKVGVRMQKFLKNSVGRVGVRIEQLLKNSVGSGLQLEGLTCDKPANLIFICTTVYSKIVLLYFMSE